MSFKVIDFCTNRKRVAYMRLPIRHGNLGPILHRFRYIARFLHPTPIFNPIFGEVLPTPDRSCWGQPEHNLS